jgi:hypothetical protein
VTCGGCTLSTSKNGAPFVDVDGTDGDVELNWPTFGCVGRVTFEALDGECEMRDGQCKQKRPCRIRNPHLAFTAGPSGATLKITAISGPVSPPSTTHWIPANTVFILPLTGPGGTGIHDNSDNPYTLEIPCGGTPLTWRIRVEAWDPQLGTVNGVEQTVTVDCAKCA